MVTHEWSQGVSSPTQTHTSAKDKTASIYPDGRYAFGIAHDSGMLWQQHGSFISSGNKILSGPYVQELLHKIAKEKLQFASVPSFHM